MQVLRLVCFANSVRMTAVLKYSCCLLECVGFGDADGKVANAPDDADALSHADGAAGVEQVEKVRTLEGQLVSGQQRKSFSQLWTGSLVGKQRAGLGEQRLCLGFVRVEVLPESRNVGVLEVVNGELQLLFKTNLAVRDRRSGIRVARPHDVINGIDVLDEGGDALETVGELGADGVQIEAAALLEVGELRDLESVEHDLPADAPCAPGGPLPVVFFELQVMLGEIDANCFK